MFELAPLPRISFPLRSASILIRFHRLWDGEPELFLNQLTSKSSDSFFFIEYSVKYLYDVQKNDQFVKADVFGNGSSGTSICMCAYNFANLA